MSVQVLHCNKTYAYFHIGFCKVNKQYDDDCENAITWQLVSSRVLNQNYSSSISIILIERSFASLSSYYTI